MKKSLVRVVVLAAIFIMACSVAAFAGDASNVLLDVLHTKGIVDDAAYNDIKKAATESGPAAADSASARMNDVPQPSQCALRPRSAAGTA